MAVLSRSNLLTVCGLLAAAGFVGAWRSHAGFYDDYDPGLPIEARDGTVEVRPGYRRVAFSFQGVPGERVPAVMALPRGGDGPWPCIIFVTGIGQDKDFLDEIAQPFVDAGFAFVSFDQYTRGERRLEVRSPIRKALAFRRRCALTVIEIRRLIDYLETRADIAPNRIFLLGASYGAMTGSTATALDERVRAAVLVCGGGDIALFCEAPAVVDELGAWRHLLRYTAVPFLGPADPVRYVDRISPRPVLFQNMLRDELVPKEAAQALFDAAGEPKEIMWYDSGHIGTDHDVVLQVITDALAWLGERDAEVKAACEAADGVGRSDGPCVRGAGE